MTEKGSLLKGIRILAVDDEEAFLQMIRLTIEQHGYRVSTASSGDLALELMQRDPPDVVLLDWQLPDRPAVSILADLHTLERRPHVIVLCVKPEVEKEAKAAGADAFVTITASSDQLVAILRKIRDGSLAL